MNHDAKTRSSIHWLAVLVPALAAIPVIYSWIMFAGPNIDTMLTYHRNLLAHGLVGMLRILSLQDQAPLPQLAHYAVHAIGFSSVIALQAATAALVVMAVLWILAMDLATDHRYQALTVSTRSTVFALGGVALLLSPSFGSSLTWVRYAVILGVTWYAVWVLEARLSAAKDAETQKRYAVILGLILGFGPMLSYTWGVVIVASLVSLRFRSGVRVQRIGPPLVLGALPGAFATLMWLWYAGSTHLALIAIRTNATSGHLFKTLGKGLHLFLYPLTGYVLFPGWAGIVTFVACAGTLGWCAALFLRDRRDLRTPFLCHLLLPIPLFVATSVTSGYGMIGPGLILTSCAIKGILVSGSGRAIAPRQVLRTAMALLALIWATYANLAGLDAMSTGMNANKSRTAAQLVVAHLTAEQALNDHTLVVAGDESSRFLISAIPSVGRRYIPETAPKSAPNIDALLRVGYPDDALLPTTNRVIALITEDPQEKFLDRWLGAEGFTLGRFQLEVGRYSPWMGRFTKVARPSQYLVKEWIR